MKTLRPVPLLFFILALSLIMTPACSDKIFTSELSSIPEVYEASDYIPLETGLTTTFAIFDSTTQAYMQSAVIEEATICGHSGYRIGWTDVTDQETKYFYRYYNNGAVYESESVDDSGYVLLTNSISIGHSWDGPVETLSEETYENKDDDNSCASPSSITGQGTISVSGYESISGSDGQTYDNCLIVVWVTAEDYVNTFWYAPGIGLVKYEFEQNPLTSTAGPEIGIISQQTN